jgi:hypothetical protein
MMKYKLTMVSITARGKRLTKFVRLPVESGGRVRLPMSAVNKMLDELKVPNGGTFSVG